MNNKFLMLTASCMLLIFTSCSKEEVSIEPNDGNVTESNGEKLARELKVYTNNGETFALVTIEATSETVANTYEHHFSNMDLQIEYLDEPVNSANVEEGIVQEKKQLEIPDNLPAIVHFDFANVVSYAHDQSDKMFRVGFNPKNEFKSPFIPWSASGKPAALAQISPMADGFKIVNTGVNANWNVADNAGTIGFSINLSGSGSVNAPVWPPLIDNVRSIMGADITWPTGTVSGIGWFYYQ